MSWTVEYTKRFFRELGRLPRDVPERVETYSSGWQGQAEEESGRSRGGGPPPEELSSGVGLPLLSRMISLLRKGKPAYAQPARDSGIPAERAEDLVCLPLPPLKTRPVVPLANRQWKILVRVKPCQIRLPRSRGIGSFELPYAAAPGKGGRALPPVSGGRALKQPGVYGSRRAVKSI